MADSVGPGEDYLAWFHQDRPGMTTRTLGAARRCGTDAYQWALEPLGNPARLVDIACGDGPVHALAPGSGWLGLDTPAAELRRARQRGARPVVRADATRIPLADGSTPAVICSMALMIVQPLDAVLAEMRQVLTVRDLYRYAQLMVVLRRTHLAHPNDRSLARLRTHSRRAGLDIVDDRRRRFALPVADEEGAERFVASLYLPGVDPARYPRAVARAAQWAPATIGIPLRRVTFRPSAPG